MKKKNNWRFLFQFIVIWVLVSALCYLVIVFPFYSDEIFESRKRFETFSSTDALFLLLSEFSSVTGALVSFWIMKVKIENVSIAKIFKFSGSEFLNGISIGLFVIVSCTLILLSFRLVSFSFNSFNLIIQAFFFLMVAVSEEVVFRGFVLANFQSRMSPISAILASSMVFSLVHIPNSHFGWIGFINIFLSGVLMSVLYLKNNNLSGPIGLHFSWNLLQNLLGFSVSGQKLEGSLHVHYLSTNTSITGGEFGLEGSLFLVPITIGIIVVLWNKESLTSNIHL